MKRLPSQADQREAAHDWEQLDLFAMVEDAPESSGTQLTFASLFPAGQVPQEVVDAVLRRGGNGKNGGLHICASYQEGRSVEGCIPVLKHEFSFGGMGLIHGGREYAVWYGVDGIHLQRGRTVRFNSRAQVLTWEQAESRVRELMETGRYLPQADLDRALENERMECAANLCDLKDEVTKTYFQGPLFEGYDHIEKTARVAEAMTDPVLMEAMADEMSCLIKEHETNPGILRFRYQGMEYLHSRIQGLCGRYTEFTAAPDFEIPPLHGFITEDEIDEDLAWGSGVEYGKYRIYSFICRDSSGRDLASMLKKEYGIGGHSPSLNSDDGNEWHDTKGICYKRTDCENVFLTWTKAAKRILALVSAQRYMTANELAHIPDYERSVLAREVYHYFSDLPEVVKRPYPAKADYYDAIKIIRPMLEDEEQTAGLVEDMETAAGFIDPHVHGYESRQKTRLNMRAYRDGTFSLFRPSSQAEPVELKRAKPRFKPAPEGQVELISPSADNQADEENEPEETSGPEPDQTPAAIPGILSEAEARIVADTCRAYKERWPDHVVAVQHGEFSYLFGGDAKTAAPLMRTKLVPSGLSDPDWADMTVFPSKSWASYSGKVWCAGHNVLVVAQYADNGQPYVGKDLLAADYIPKGAKLELDGRRYMVEEVFFDQYSVSLRDITFQDSAEAPVFRRETTFYIRELWEEQQSTEENFDFLLERDRQEPSRQEAIAGNFRITDDHLGEGGPKTKFAANIAAIETLKQIELEKRHATPEEQETLSRYVGWGGLAEAFDPGKEKWAKEFAQLKDLLTDEEYTAARASVLNAHYTSPTVIKAIYQCIGNMGFTHGNVLEPAMGVGNFFGLLPEEMVGSKLYGVELDPITGRIAKQLYPKARIVIKGFEETKWPDNFFDVAVGNVPFGAYPVQDPRYDRLGFHIHDYFFAKTIDQIRPGGVLAFVTSRYTMDKKDGAVRRYIAQRCDLLGAVRLPNNAFLANAGTEVTADILFLQKRDHPIGNDPDWVLTGQTPDGMAVNQYFLDHPEMVLGTLVKEKKLYGSEDLVCKPYPGADLSSKLAGAVELIHAELPVLIPAAAPEGETETDNGPIEADPGVKNFSFALVGGRLYFRENSVMNPVNTSGMGEARIRGMIGVRDAVRALIDAQMSGCGDDVLHSLQDELTSLYDDYTAKYGLLNSRGNDMAFSDDASYPLLCALEVLDDDGKLKRKADIFSKRTIRQESTVTHVETAVEALAVSIGERACVDLGYMTSLLGRPGDHEAVTAALHGVIFRDPTAGDDPMAGWQTADEYLSGNVRQKLRIAREWAEKEPGRYDENVSALTAAQPKDLEAGEIGVRLGTTWIPASDYQQFVFDLLETPQVYRPKIKVVFAGVNGGIWNISGKNDDLSDNVKANTVYGTNRINAYEIIQASLNLKTVQVKDAHEVDGHVVYILNKKATFLAQQKQESIQQAFKDWIWKDPERRARLTAFYNEHFNDTRPREYDGSHIRFVGMNPEIKLRKHQLDAVARILYGGNTLLSQAVGAGKTWTMAAAAMEGKRLGLCQKSLFVVPSHLTEQWGAEFLQLYPAANILVATKKDFQKQNRRKFCGRIATGDYDAVIIGHSQFEKIPMSPERQQAQLKRQIREVELGIEQLKAEEGERYTIKQMEYTRKTLEGTLKNLTSTARKDNVITFEEQGVDRLFVDEAHYYKNLFLYTKMRNVAGISQTEAKKSSDLYMKCLYLDEQTAVRPGGPGRGVIFATGTPISNSMTELYTMMRYLQNEMLERKSLAFFDSWASTFGETVTVSELKPEGTGYQAKTRFAKFHNLPELMNTWKEVADVQTADMLKLPVPIAHYHVETIQPSIIQRQLVKNLGDRAESIRGGNVDPSIDNMLKITNEGRNIAMDQRLMNLMFPDEADSKVNRCVENVFQIWRSTMSRQSAQMVFCDLSTPKHQVKNVDAAGNVTPPPFSVYYDIKDKLVAKGVPAREIAFIHDANTDTQKAALFARVRAGQVRVLLGSTSKMGAGTNAQTRLVALHHLDVPWRPSDIEQREGRILRQGNQNPEVDIYRYVTEGTFDAYSWQIIESKQRFIGQVVTSKSQARSCEDVDSTALSYAEVKALATGNPKIKEKMDLEVEVSKLSILRSSFQSEHHHLEDKLLKDFPSQLRLTESKIAACTADMDILSKHPIPSAETFKIIIDGKNFTKKDEAGEALIAFALKVKGNESEIAGEYRGMRLEIYINPISNEYMMGLRGEWVYSSVMSSDAQGNIARLNHALERVPTELISYKEKLATIQRQMEDATAELSKPWPQEGEWMMKSTRLAELNAELSLDMQEGGRFEDDTGREPAQDGEVCINEEQDEEDEFEL